MNNNFLKQLGTSVNIVLDTSIGRLTNVGYLPRWGVLFIDLFICFMAILTSTLIIELDVVLEHIKSNAFLISAILLLTNLISFILFKTYAGLIRHSSYIDAIKLFLATSTTLFITMAINYGYYLQSSSFLIPRSYLIIYFLVSFSLLFLFRVLVKQVFEAYFNESRNKETVKVLILGTDSNAVSVAGALKSESPSRFEVLGFLDTEKKNAGKRILGLPIVHLRKKTSVILRSRGAEGIIITSNTLTRSQKNTIVDDCLEFNYKVFRVPLVANLEDDKPLTDQIKNIQIEDLLERDPILLDNKLIAKDLFNKTIVVTGGAGSIGSEIVRQIAHYRSKKIILIDQAETPLYQIQSEVKTKYPESHFEFIIADVSNYNILEHLFKIHRPDIVYHAAAYKHVPLMENNPSEAIMVNVLGSKNMADLSLKYDVTKFVLVSTDKAVNPSNIMGASKRIAEMYIQSLHYFSKQSKGFKTRFITTRFGNVLGSNGSVVPLFKEQIAKGGPLTITHPDIIRYFMTIPEACQLVLEAASMGNGGEIFIFDMGKAVKIIDLATKIIKLAGFIPYKDIDIKVIGLRPGEKLYEELLCDKTTNLPTYHEKIMIAKIEAENYNLLSEEISILIDYAKQFNNHKIVSQMKVIVPEYKSMNSKYETLDA